MESPRALARDANLHAWLRLMRDGTPLEPHLISMVPHPRSHDEPLAQSDRSHRDRAT